MNTPDPEKPYPPSRYTHPPPGYQQDSEGDDYASDDELVETDLNVLNADYAAQRDFSFYPASHHHRKCFNPSRPPSLEQSGNRIEYIDHQSEEYPPDTYGRVERPSVSPRHIPPRKSMANGGSRYRLPQHNAHAYQTHPHRRPLIDLIHNEWRNSPYTPTSSSPTSQGYAVPNWVQVISAPRFRRYMFFMFGILSLIWTTWHYWAGPQLAEHQLLGDSLKERMSTGDGWFGENLRPEFVDMVHVMTLDQEMIPQKGDGKRLIVVGDVHGCHDELVSLLAKVQYEARSDHLIFAGDFISKGPSSPAVVDLAMSAHASCVRGNHEDRVLLAYRDMYSHRMTHEQKAQKSQKVPPPPMPGMPEDMLQNEPPEDIVGEESFEHGDLVDRRLAKSFTKRQIDYMAGCPVILDVGHVKGLGDVHVVHGGLIPGVRLEKQDPVGVMRMRTIDLDTYVPSGNTKGTAWFKLWNKYQTLIPSEKRSTVIYGHDSHRGLQIHDYSKGLDTGCVHGGKLTALVIEGSVQAQSWMRTVSVQCKDYGKPKTKAGVDAKGAVE